MSVFSPLASPLFLSPLTPFCPFSPISRDLNIHSTTTKDKPSILDNQGIAVVPQEACGWVRDSESALSTETGNLCRAILGKVGVRWRETQEYTHDLGTLEGGAAARRYSVKCPATAAHALFIDTGYNRYHNFTGYNRSYTFAPSVYNREVNLVFIVQVLAGITAQNQYRL